MATLFRPPRGTRPAVAPPPPACGSAAAWYGRDLRAALDAVLAEKPVPGRQQPSIGCNIKWKPGHEPDYCHAG